MNEIKGNEGLKEIRLILIGEHAVGKSSILIRYCDNEFGLNMLGTSTINIRTKFF